MMLDFDMNVVWWITVVELPALSGLLLLIVRVKREVHEALDTEHRRLDDDLEKLRGALADHKVAVAETYASVPALRDAEGRLTSHLVRIEKKLDSLGFQGAGALA